MKKKVEYVFDDKDNGKYEYVVARRKKKKGNPFLIAIVAFLVFVFIGSGSNSTDTPSATSAPTQKAVITGVPTSTPFISATPKRTNKPTAKPTATPTKTPAPTPEETEFTIEHDEEYYATQEYIYKFLTEKGYEVQTIIGVPNIGRIEDNDPDDLTVPWYAYVMHKGKWTQFNVLLFNGEVSFIRPMQ